jgi:hypothetical protein
MNVIPEMRRAHLIWYLRFYEGGRYFTIEAYLKE